MRFCEAGKVQKQKEPRPNQTVGVSVGCKDIFIVSLCCLRPWGVTEPQCLSGVGGGDRASCVVQNLCIMMRATKRIDASACAY